LVCTRRTTTTQAIRGTKKLANAESVELRHYWTDPIKTEIKKFFLKISGHQQSGSSPLQGYPPAPGSDGGR
jgi:hypothetical protein